MKKYKLGSVQCRPHLKTQQRPCDGEQFGLKRIILNVTTCLIIQTKYSAADERDKE